MLIGISGKIGSGKSTLADLIVEYYPEMIFQQRSFAEKLKKISAIILNLPIDLMYTQEGKNYYLSNWEMTVGQFQQKLGTEGMRNGVHQNGWIIALLSEYDDTQNWIITDVRFKNEAKAIKKAGGKLIRVTGDPKSINKNSMRDHIHISETDLDNWVDWDLIIKNKPPIENLEWEVNELKNKFSCFQN